MPHLLMEKEFRRWRFVNLLKGSTIGIGDSPTFSKKVLSALAIHQSFERKCFRRWRFTNLLKGSTFGDCDLPNFWKKVLSALAIRQSFERMCFRRWRLAIIWKIALGDSSYRSKEKINFNDFSLWFNIEASLEKDAELYSRDQRLLLKTLIRIG